MQRRRRWACKPFLAHLDSFRDEQLSRLTGVFPKPSEEISDRGPDFPEAAGRSDPGGRFFWMLQGSQISTSGFSGSFGEIRFRRPVLLDAAGRSDFDFRILRKLRGNQISTPESSGSCREIGFRFPPFPEATGRSDSGV
jgi:hypothetical protein